MNRDNIFWGGALILLGALFLLQTQNIIPSIWPYIWPLALILLGLWIIISVYWRSDEGETFSIPLEGARTVKYKFSHGAGQIDIKGGAPAGQAITGLTAEGVNRKSRLDGDRLDVQIEAGASFIPFIGPSGGVFRFQLSNEVPAIINVETGASQLDMDLTDIPASEVRLQTGASNSNITLPARGASHMVLEAGAASVNIRIPEGVAGRIRIKEGLTSLSIDKTRFPQVDTRLYQAVDYDSAENRAELNIEAGVGSISIK
ncbi:MAG TPA: DUF5668 domain-containing protein [Anaerolineales bacterium]|nr:DUF5668 domain-containing protein [Anaerolineales bacterium]